MMPRAHAQMRQVCRMATVGCRPCILGEGPIFQVRAFAGVLPAWRPPTPPLCVGSRRTMAAGALDTGLVQSSWAAVCPEPTDEVFETVGTLIFETLFETTPEAKALFPFAERANKAQQKLWAKHVRDFTKTVDDAVKGLGDLESTAAVLESLGRRHNNYGVVEAHYDAVGKTLLVALEKALGPKGLWTPATKDAWAGVWGVVAGCMKKGQGIA